MGSNARGVHAHRRSHVTGNYRHSLRSMITASGLTLTEVARRIGVCRATLHGYLRSDRPVPLLVMNALERYRLLPSCSASWTPRPARATWRVAGSGRYWAMWPAAKKVKPVSKPLRPVVAKAVKPVRKRVRAKCYDRDLKYLPREQTDPPLHPISAGFRTIALSIGGARKTPG